MPYSVAYHFLSRIRNKEWEHQHFQMLNEGFYQVQSWLEYYLDQVSTHV